MLPTDSQILDNATFNRAPLLLSLLFFNSRDSGRKVNRIFMDELNIRVGTTKGIPLERFETKSCEHDREKPEGAVNTGLVRKGWHLFQRRFPDPLYKNVSTTGGGEGKATQCSSFEWKREWKGVQTFLSSGLKMSVKARRFNLVMRRHWGSSKELERRAAFYAPSSSFYIYVPTFFLLFSSSSSPPEDSSIRGKERTSLHRYCRIRLEFGFRFFIRFEEWICALTGKKASVNLHEN